MKDLIEIAQKLSTINTKYFQEEDIKDIDINSYDLATIIYKKDDVMIVLASNIRHGGYGYYYEESYLFATGLTCEEKKQIEEILHEVK